MLLVGGRANVLVEKKKEEFGLRVHRVTPSFPWFEFSLTVRPQGA